MWCSLSWRNHGVTGNRGVPLAQSCLALRGTVRGQQYLFGARITGKHLLPIHYPGTQDLAYTQCSQDDEQGQQKGHERRKGLSLYSENKDKASCGTDAHSSELTSWVTWGSVQLWWGQSTPDKVTRDLGSNPASTLWFGQRISSSWISLLIQKAWGPEQITSPGRTHVARLHY